MSFTEDKSAFFNVTEHADTGLYNGSVSVNGIVRQLYFNVDQGEGVGVSTQETGFEYAVEDIPGATVGTAFVVNSTSYTVRDIQENNGMGMLMLEKV